ncbi:hypothetical protein COL26b_004859 [Colletotrichum chrysophilum]|uniref:uncharacterized protein n=1 Tax=Colletotrichum chrysophilum TaxID=1836956 RepID=UPI00230173D8|nr:uncharacterized protein COL26b_004859 [Colletotrichum chrysophilum]KAJ0376807.1 hypothetical protein COL26b_004859 [Colletotrichum chrysophilum]
MSAWDQYFARQQGGFPIAAGLRNQLHDLAGTAFVSKDSETQFDVLDIDDNGNKFHASEVRVEDDLNRVLEATPTAGIRIITINPLRITSPLAARLFDKYQVRAEFLRVLLSFGDEPHLSEAGSANSIFLPQGNDAYTLLYKLNFVERNERPGPDKWSFRHVGVYHQRTPGFDLFILLHCQPASELAETVQDIIEEEDGGSDELDDEKSPPMGAFRQHLCSQPATLHQYILSCYLDNWRAYLRHLGSGFSRILDMAMVPHAKMDHDVPKVTFESVRELRNTNDFALFASACCQSNLEVTGCILYSGRFPEAQAAEFRSMETVLRGYIESSAVLRQRVDNTVELASYTLSLHNQKELQLLTHEMKTHIKNTGDVTLKLKELTENTVDDSAIVRIITIISAIYLPGSFVGSLFGSNYFSFNEKTRKIAVARDFWVFVLIWLLLTVVTVAAYVYTYMKKKKKKNGDRTLKEIVRDVEKDSDNYNTPPPPPFPRRLATEGRTPFLPPRRFLTPRKRG